MGLRRTLQCLQDTSFVIIGEMLILMLTLLQQSLITGKSFVNQFGCQYLDSGDTCPLFLLE